MSEDTMFQRAHKFFEKNRRMQSATSADPEVRAHEQSVSSQMKGIKKDKQFQTSLMNTLRVLERDMAARRIEARNNVLQQFKASGRKVTAGDEAEIMKKATAAIPRELRSLQLTGLSVVKALNSDTALSVREMEKVLARIDKFSSRLDDVRSGKLDVAGSKQDGISLTERIRQYKEGQLLDGKRHQEMMEKMDQGRKEAAKLDDVKKLGLTALLGPAAPLFQLWYDAKEELKEIREKTGLSLGAMREKFRWDRVKDEETKDRDNTRTGLFERMFRAFSRQSQGASGKSGLLGWLFGGDGPDVDVDMDRRSRGRSKWGRRARYGARRASRSVGRTAGRVLQGAKGLGSRISAGVATAARAAWPAVAGFAGQSMGALAAGGAGTLAAAGAAVAGAGYAGYKAGGLLYESLSPEQQEAIGNAIGKSVDAVAEAGSTVASALGTAGARLSGFFDTAKTSAMATLAEGQAAGQRVLNSSVASVSGFYASMSKKTGDEYDRLMRDLGEKATSAQETLLGSLTSVASVLGDWSDKAKRGLSAAASEVKNVAVAATVKAATVVAPVVQNTKDFVAPQSGGQRLEGYQKSSGERARESLDSQVDKGRAFFNPAGRDMEAALRQEMDAQGIKDPNERAMILAQMSHETNGFRSKEESFKYRDPQRIAQVSKTAGSKGTEAIKAAMAKGPEAVAELMYGGRMGNTQEGDAYKYRGRGATQLTGKANYERYGKMIGVDLVKNPELASDPAISAKLAMVYWKDRGLGAAARNGDVQAVTKGINGGLNGLSDRESKYAEYRRNEGLTGGVQPVPQGMAATSGAGRSTAGAAMMDPRRTDAQSIRVAGSKPGTQMLVPEYKRVESRPAMTPQQVVQQRGTANTASSGATGKVGMDASDFYVDDLGLIILNRGYRG